MPEFYTRDELRKVCEVLHLDPEEVINITLTPDTVSVTFQPHRFGSTGHFAVTITAVVTRPREEDVRDQGSAN
jgi:hypothetical protein